MTAHRGKTLAFALLASISACALLLAWIGPQGGHARQAAPAADTLPPAPPRDTAADAALGRSIAALHADLRDRGFSGAMLAARDTAVVFESYLTRDPRRRPDTIGPGSLFQLASVSKQFTAAAVLQLAAEGRLRLGDSLSLYLPQLPYPGVTIEQLLCHRSGLPNYIYFLDAKAGDKSQPIAMDTLARMLAADPPAPYARPGRRFRYSNTGYVALAMVVERVSGMPFHRYARERLFAPAGMATAQVLQAGQNDNFPGMLPGFSARWRDHREDYLNGCVGDKGVYCTARELLAWQRALVDGKILPDSMLRLAWQPHGRPAGNKANYGYGWRMMDIGGDRYYYHSGWWQGFRTMLVYSPAHDATVLALKNTLAGAMATSSQAIDAVRRALDPAYRPPGAPGDTLPPPDDYPSPEQENFAAE